MTPEQRADQVIRAQQAAQRTRDWLQTLSREERARLAEQAQPAAASPAQDELGNARALAKEWLAVVTGLFGLFSISGLVFSDNVAESLTGPIENGVFGLSALCAILFAAAAIFLATSAAHGWPEVPRQHTFRRIRGKLRPNYEPEVHDAAILAARSIVLLHAGLAAALVSLGLLAALSVLWFWE